jgi:GDPmannose 4,6-dehydratase
VAKRALITGITGQDGTYLAELLVAEGYDVAGLVRTIPDAPPPGLEAVHDEIRYLQGELGDEDALRAAVDAARPDELYHLAAPTFVPDSWRDPTATFDAIVGGTARLLAAVLAGDDGTRVYVAASSEIFGDSGESPQCEASPTRPRSPYGVAKLAAHGLVRVMRDHHGLFAVSGITYNHESPRRPVRFLSRKVTHGVAEIAAGRSDGLTLGDLRAVRDWSHAADVVRGAWLALQAPSPSDYVLASGVGHTVGDLVDAAFAAAGIAPDGRVHVDPRFVRGPEATPPVGDPSHARHTLGWEPAYTFEAMIAEMVEADLRALRA